MEYFFQPFTFILYVSLGLKWVELLMRMITLKKYIHFIKPYIFFSVIDEKKQFQFSLSEILHSNW